MEHLTEILEAVDAGDLSAFSDEQLAELADQIKEYGRSLKPESGVPSTEELADAETIKLAYETVTAELTVRAEKAQEMAGKAEEVFKAFDDPEPTEEPAPEPVEELEPITASRPSAADVAKRRPRSADPKPEPALAIVAAALEAEGKMGTRFADSDELADAINAAWNRTTDGVRPVARINRQHRYQVGGDAVSNFDVFQKVMREAQAARQNEVALTAALGCAPSEPVYDFFGVGDASAGILDLPMVTARRGSRTYPPIVGPVNLTGQTGIGTEYTGASKTCFTVNCGATRDFEVVANFTCLTFDNEEGLFYPELVNHYTAESLVVHAHEVNQRLIENIRDADATTTVHDLDTNGGTVIGLLRAVVRTRAYLLERHKMSESTVVEVLFPFWFAAAYAADIAARQSSDWAQTVNIGLARMAADFRQAGANLQFLYDWQAGPAEGFDDFGSFLLFAPGTVVQLEGPTLDLGIVRDSTLNAANDFQTFVETWTGVAVPGPEILYVQGVETCPSGATGATAALTCGAS